MREQLARRFGPATENIVIKLREIEAECIEVEQLPDFKNFNSFDQEAFKKLTGFIKGMTSEFERYRSARGYFEQEKKTDNVIYVAFEPRV